MVKTEEKFHDEWAVTTDVRSIDIVQMNEAQTAPEMRCIRKLLGDLHGKRLLDVGCGLGEGAAYFALQGAEVMAMDISQKMLDAAMELARHNRTKISVIKGSAEDAAGLRQEQFDVIYAGNFFHHVDINAALKNLSTHLTPDGVLVSWDPVAYNPIINVYRKIVTKVRTLDEHPLTVGDIRLFQNYFGQVETRWFWFTTLVIFVLMAVVQRRNPNKERYWKTVIQESRRWEWLYDPLEKVDSFLLSVLPFLKPLCWNVVIVASNPRTGE